MVVFSLNSKLYSFDWKDENEFLFEKLPTPTFNADFSDPKEVSQPKKTILGE